MDQQISTTDLAKPQHTRRGWFRVGLLAVGIIWAVFVCVRYLQVDDGFFIPSLVAHARELHGMVVYGLIIFCVLLACGFAFGYAAGRSHQSSKWLWLAGVAGLCLLAWSLEMEALGAWKVIADWLDGWRILFLVGAALIFGLGFYMGIRLAKHQPPLWYVIMLATLPTLIVTLQAHAVMSLAGLIWLLVVADAVGWSILKVLARVSRSSISLDKGDILGVAIGLGVLSVVTLGLGLIGLVSAASLIILLILLTALMFSPIRARFARWNTLKWNQPVELSLAGWLTVAMFVAVFIVLWIAALAPEIGSDALGLRIASPAIWMREGRIEALPETMWSYGFMGAETIYLLAMPFIGFSTAKVLQFGLGVLLLVSAFRQVDALGQDNSLPVWMFAFWGSTLIWWQMFWGSVDLFQVFYVYACMIAIRIWLDDLQPVWLAVAGLAGAAGTVVKLNGVVALSIAFLVIVAVTLRRKRAFNTLVTNSIWLALPAALIILPWMLRALALTGNPVFPFANQLFKSPLAPLELTAVRFGPGLAFPSMAAIPWRVFFNPTQFVELGTYHPFLLAFAPLALIGLWGLRWRDNLWLLAGLMGSLAWLVTDQNLRYSLYAVFLLSIAIGLGLSRLSKASTRSGQRLLSGLGVIVIVLGLGVQVLRPTFPLGGASNGPLFPDRVTFGEQTQANYLAKNIPTYLCAEWLNRNYGEKAKVWQMPDIRDHLYFLAHASSWPHGVVPITQPLMELLVDPRWVNDPAAIHQRLLDLGYTHIMYNAVLSSIADTPEAERIGIYSPNFERDYLELECANQGLRLYKIRPVPAVPNQALTSASQNLLQNPSFDALDSNNDPLAWDMGTKSELLSMAENRLLHVQADDQVNQAVDVHETRIYELEAKVESDTSQSRAYVQMNWLDQNGKLLLFWREPISHPGSMARFRFLQTAPPGARHAVVYLLGQAKFDDISLRELGDVASSVVTTVPVPNSAPVATPAATAGPLRANQLYPSQTQAGQGFNVQPGGQSALAIICENATPDTVVIFGNTPLDTAYGNPASVSAIVPDELFARAGRYEVYLKDEAGESNRLEFVVDP